MLILLSLIRNCILFVQLNECFKKVILSSLAYHGMTDMTIHISPQNLNHPLG